jgi:4-amino-4-deoxy-L-arabinose transferase-like glycosyltransferase
MRSWFRNPAAYFVPVTAMALALRLYFVFQYPVVSGDAFFYGDLARNWLTHGILGTTELNGIHPSLIRLPGYPAFLALVWKFSGIEHYRAVLLVQAVIDTGTCFLTADLARRMLRSARAAKVAFFLAAICPFTANYAACALSETLAIFFTALALDMAVAAFDSGRQAHWAGCGGAVAAGILLRPDGGILLGAIGGYLLLLGGRNLLRGERPWWRSLGGTRLLLLFSVALVPLVPWTIRNWRDFQVFQPLAPRYANGPDQTPPMGFERWVKTWMVDYVSVSEIYWQLGEEPIDISNAPSRAFDSNQERKAVENLFQQYNVHHDWTEELDGALGKIAALRVARNRLRYYVWLPALRIADMWLRPRTEMIGISDRWWQVQDDPEDSAAAIALGVLNLLYVTAAALGAAWMWHTKSRPGMPQPPPPWGMLLIFVAARSLFLGTLENPEPRYTLECYPVVVVFAAALLAATARSARSQKSTPDLQEKPAGFTTRG